MEKITLNSALKVRIDNGATIWRVGVLSIQRSPANIGIVLYESDADGSFTTSGRRAGFEYNDTSPGLGPTGTTTADLITALNKANLSVKSLERRILERLQTDGRIGTGTISGTP